jgi:hypothetical protein
MVRPLSCLIVAVAAAALAAPASAQTLLQRRYGAAAGEGLGVAIAARGPDLDGDGFAEIAVSIRQPDNSGGVDVLSGADFSILQSLRGAGGELLGFSLAWVADADGDGVEDLAVGSPSYNSGAFVFPEGRVQIFSSATWTVLRTFDGASDGASLGWSLADVGDHDGDGISDLLVGEPYYRRSNGFGQALLFSGADGSTLATLSDPGSDLFGWSVADVGDTNCDGVDDLGIGAPLTYTTFKYGGAAYVFSGTDESLLQEWTGVSISRSYSWYADELGAFIGAAGDYDGDGCGDVWVASNYGANGPAYVKVFSGASGALLRTFDSFNRNTAVAAVGDLDGDGLTDIAAGGIFQATSIRADDAVALFSSRDGGEFWREDVRTTDSALGAALAAAGDVDRDGRPDFCVSAELDDNVATDAGRVDLLGGDELWLDVTPDHRPTQIDVLGLGVAFGPPGNLAGVALTKLNGAPTFQFLWIQPLDSAGRALWSMKVPAGLAGTTVSLRAFAITASGRLAQSKIEALAF